MPGATETVIVLPPNEGFGPDEVGAIGLLVHRLARAGAGGLVLGAPTRCRPFDGVPFRPVAPGWGLTRTARYINGVAAVLREVEPTLVEVHNRPEIALRLARHRRRVSLILNNDPQRMRGAGSAWQRRRMLRRLALVTVSSHWLRGRLLDGVTRPVREPVILPNCVDLPPWPAGPREALILFVGRLVADKGADRFVEACARVLPRLPGWRAEMIGADRFRRDCPDTPFVAQLRPMAGAAAVSISGHLPNQAVLAAMQRAAIVVVPSRWQEPFGLVALEAMACGAALVCSPSGGLPEVAGQTALFADPEQPQALAAAIFQLATDVGLRATLAAAARLRAEGFGASRTAARLCELRSEALALA